MQEANLIFQTILLAVLFIGLIKYRGFGGRPEDRLEKLGKDLSEKFSEPVGKNKRFFVFLTAGASIGEFFLLSGKMAALLFFVILPPLMVPLFFLFLFFPQSSITNYSIGILDQISSFYTGDGHYIGAIVLICFSFLVSWLFTYILGTKKKIKNFIISYSLVTLALCFLVIVPLAISTLTQPHNERLYLLIAGLTIFFIIIPVSIKIFLEKKGIKIPKDISLKIDLPNYSSNSKEIGPDSNGGSLMKIVQEAIAENPGITEEEMKQRIKSAEGGSLSDEKEIEIKITRKKIN